MIAIGVHARHAVDALGSMMLASGLALAAATDTVPATDATNLITVIVAFLSAGGIGGIVARAMIANWQKERDRDREREDEDRAAERAERDRVLTLLEKQLEVERARVDQLVTRQYVTNQTVEQQVVKS